MAAQCLLSHQLYPTCALHISVPPSARKCHQDHLQCRLVRGRTLSKHMCSRHTYTQESWEQQVLEVAAQLLDVSKLFVYMSCCDSAL